MARSRSLPGKARKRGTGRKRATSARKPQALKAIKSSVKGATTNKKRSSRAKSGRSPHNVTVSVNGQVVHRS